jgi:gamma-tubulin complex component 2
MQTCTIFAAYTNWLTRELEKSDPDLSGTNCPSTMTADQWKRFQATKSSAVSRGSTNAAHADTSTASATDAEARISNLFEIIRKWEGNFSRHLQILLDALNHYAATETVVLLSLCARLSTANQGTEHAGVRTDGDAA